MRRILDLAGYDLRLGKPAAADEVLVWGRSPVASRGEAVATATGSRLVRVEDAFLRGLFPGRSGEPPLGLVIDRTGIYFDASQPSDLETLLATDPLDDTALLNRARDAVARMQAAHLTKFAALDPDIAPPDPGYVLVIDQTEGDASIRHGGADRATFQEALYWAAEDHPGARILVKTHPETAAGHRPGHLSADDLQGYGGRAKLYSEPVSPWRLMDGAIAVYTVTSQLGFEAILAGHRPVVFGQPFYAGWGLSDDRRDIPRRGRRLTRAQLAAACLILYPIWYDPYRDRLGTVEDALGTLEAEARAWREDRAGATIFGASGWKHRHLRRFFGTHGRVGIAATAGAARRHGAPLLVWASAATPKGLTPAARIEDGFLRSRGLGARLVPPLSLVRDDLGIYYDPTRPSRFEACVAEAAALPAAQLDRAARLVATLTGAGLTKYSTGAPFDIPQPGDRAVMLVVGQVENDASLRHGAGPVATNAALLAWARSAFPAAFLIYKPHPDVEAGLRPGRVDDLSPADHVARGADPAALLSQVNRVVTMTSTLGFEAILRGVPVTTLGAPFYAGWGLTDDRGPVPARRAARPSVDALAHAALISYPRYLDPVTQRPCPPEIAVARLADGVGFRPTPSLRLLARLQDLRGRLAR
ncbi:MAG: capsular polysaccharide biosynthesis protein [Pseudomonadota bacterium]